jgi:competence protein ComEC
MGAPSAAVPPLRDLIWESPLVPVALVATAGLLLDRYLAIPVAAWGVGFIAAFAAWVRLIRKNTPRAAAALWLAAGCLTGAYHHYHRNLFPSDDIGTFATDDQRLVRVRGVLDDEPTRVWLPRGDPLASYLRPDPTHAVLDVRELLGESGWVPVSGLARLSVQGHLDDLHAGDEVEVTGWLAAPQAPGNPGGWDYREYLRDKRVRAELFVRKTTDAVAMVQPSGFADVENAMARVRGWAQRACARTLPKQEAAIASALLLGEGSTMTANDWDKYIRTGVIHVLAISGQHLVVLAAFLWVVLRLLPVRRKHAAIFVAVFLVVYAMLTGFHPPVQRAAVTVAVTCLGVVLRRSALPANNFALAWLVVIALNPTDVFGMGCQLAFTQVAILVWGLARWLDARPDDPVEKMIDETRTVAERVARGVARNVGRMYAITAILTLAAIPLVAARHHLASFAGFVIGPPVILLTSVALIGGFLMLISEALGGLLTPLFALPTRWSLSAADWIVDRADANPYSHVYVADLPEWWVWAFYLVVLAALWWRPIWPWQRWLIPFGLGWLIVGLSGALNPRPAGDLSVVFLAVGKGGCTVVETPDGRTLVYDTGAVSGPDVTRRTVAPYLWYRGVRRIDELFLSHADLDHFNGVVELLERFDVGLITLTPSFSQKGLPGVQKTVAEINRLSVPIRIAQAGDRLTAGGVTLDVLHPPGAGPDGNENVRSLVLKLRYEGRTVLLTGDLEGPGLGRVLALPAEPVDVLMAPHHGSATANTPDLARWARPALVVSCQGRPSGARAKKPDPYAEVNAPVWGTWPHGAVTIRWEPAGLVAETYLTKQRIVIPRRP